MNAALDTEWRAHATAHPDDAAAWTQLSRAASYAGAPCDSAVTYPERALRLAPHDPCHPDGRRERRWTSGAESP